MDEIKIDIFTSNEGNCVFLCSFVGATMGTPADVVKARIMNQPTDKSGRGKGESVVADRLVPQPLTRAAFYVLK